MQLALLPEVFTLCGVPIDKAPRHAEPLDDSPTLRAVSAVAARHAMHVVCGLLVREECALLRLRLALHRALPARRHARAASNVRRHFHGKFLKQN